MTAMTNQKDPRSQAERAAAFERAKMEINIFAAPHRFFGPPLPKKPREFKGNLWDKTTWSGYGGSKSFGWWV